MNSTFLQDQIDATKAQIIAYSDAALALGSGGVQSYMIDTGQSRQTVTKFDIDKIQATIDSLYNRYSTLCIRAGVADSTMIARPCW